MILLLVSANARLLQQRPAYHPWKSPFIPASQGYCVTFGNVGRYRYWWFYDENTINARESSLFVRGIVVLCKQFSQSNPSLRWCFTVTTVTSSLILKIKDQYEVCRMHENVYYTYVYYECILCIFYVYHSCVLSDIIRLKNGNFNFNSAWKNVRWSRIGSVEQCMTWGGEVFRDILAYFGKCKRTNSFEIRERYFIQTELTLKNIMPSRLISSFWTFNFGLRI